MNIGVFTGRVGGDAEVRYTQGGKAVASFSIAIDNGKSKDGEKKAATWITATLWEKRAESLTPYIKKGIMVSVSGPVSSQAWIDKNDGSAKSKVVVTVREFTFAGGGEKREGAAPVTPPDSNEYAPPEATNEDIPF